MTVYLYVDDLVDIATTVLKAPLMVRDYGLLTSAAPRPATVVSDRRPTRTCSSRPPGSCTP